MEPVPVCDAFIAAAEQCGYRAQSGLQRRAPRRALATTSSPRATAAAARPRSDISSRRGARPNLKVISGALATRVTFEGRRAIGVEYRTGQRTHVAHATAEVILSGGAFNTPQLMQLSGLGPASLLREHGIEVIADMPGVGADLQDHYPRPHGLPLHAAGLGQRSS